MIQKVLIANRGEIARRIVRTCRAMGIGSVAVFSDPDRDALFVNDADEAVALGGATPAESYLRIKAVVEAARRTGADAVHPGYGFLAENAAFAQACLDADLTLIGPSPAAIEAMGSKIEAKARVQAAGVPVLSTIAAAGRKPDDLAREATRLGFPLLVKASGGGGGRGMRIINAPGELTAAIDLASREAAAAFGDDCVFLEPYLRAPRHIEFQVFGDKHGRIVQLFERECSIQRRHQKIIEESPSPALGNELRGRMGEAAVRAAQAVDYVGAGTIEFLLDADGKFYFLEMNTRLQVEHPVTEMVTGLDLVRLQLLVAEGGHLPVEATEAVLTGHAIEARLYAEDPLNDYRPATGTMHRFRLPSVPGLRIESAVADGSEISPYYDSLIAKVIVHAAARPDAARQLATVLAAAQLHGPTTNRDLLVRILRHPEFVSGHTDTHFLERHPPSELGRPLADASALQRHAVAAALAGQAERRRDATALETLPSGWRNSPSQLQVVRFAVGDALHEVRYGFSRNGLSLEFDGAAHDGAVLDVCAPEEVVLSVDGVRQACSVHRVGETWYVDSAAGSSQLQELPRYPLPDAAEDRGSLMAPFPGVVAEIKVTVGANVAAGDPLLVIESMKMFHPIVAPVAGALTELRVAVGAHVQAGALLAVIDATAAATADSGTADRAAATPSESTAF
ncbi:MAG: biotin/lipoyl-binding protein [Pirellulales bacterium]|nr:biotin/lipoyl-binding protein [Pirellulales bacterium]